jgi:excisionase family DNA binding protein
MTLRDVAQILSVSSAQAYALVRSGDLPAIQVGGRGQWRVEVTKLEEFINRLYDDASASLR